MEEKMIDFRTKPKKRKLGRNKKKKEKYRNSCRPYKYSHKYKPRAHPCVIVPSGDIHNYYMHKRTMSLQCWPML